jgi:hypothetical protein
MTYTCNHLEYSSEDSSSSSAETSYTLEDQPPSPMDSFVSPRSSMELPINIPFSSHSSWSSPYTRPKLSSPTPPARGNTPPARNRQVGSALRHRPGFNPFFYGWQPAEPDVPDEDAELCNSARHWKHVALGRAQDLRECQDAVREQNHLQCVNFPEHCSWKWCDSCGGVLERQCDACRFPKRSGWNYLVLVVVCLGLVVAGISLWGV